MATPPLIVWNVFTNNFDYTGPQGGGAATEVTINADVGTAVSISGVLLGQADQTDADNDAGIYMAAGTTEAGASNAFKAYLTNRKTGEVETTDDVFTDIITFPLGVDGAIYSMQGTVTARNPADGDGGSYDFYAGFGTDGLAATELGAEYPTAFESASMADADIEIHADGNNAVLRVKGLAATSIDWDAVLTYRKRL